MDEVPNNNTRFNTFLRKENIMAIKSTEDLMNSLNTFLGDRDDDDALELIQDFTDTLDDLSKNHGGYTQQQYDDLDASWRKRYRERFFSGPHKGDEEFDANDDSNDDEEDNSKTIQIRDLFSKK